MKEISTSHALLGKTLDSREESIGSIMSEVAMIKQQLAHPNIVRYHKCFQVRCTKDRNTLKILCVINTVLKLVLCVEGIVTSLETAVQVCCIAMRFNFELYDIGKWNRLYYVYCD